MPVLVEELPPELRPLLEQIITERSQSRSTFAPNVLPIAPEEEVLRARGDEGLESHQGQ